MAKEDWCPRQSWFRLSGAQETDPQKKHGYQLENIFDEGHYVHEKWQNRLWDMGVLEGNFGCLICDAKWWDTAPSECWMCGASRKVLRYHEVPVDGYKRYLIVGHEDGKVGRRLVEIKTIGQGTLRLDAPEILRENMVEGPKGNKIYDLDGIWKSLKRPLAPHLRQTGIYAAILNEQEDPRYHVDEIVFIYEYKANQDVKEFTVKVNNRHAQHLLDTAKDIKYAIDSNTPVPRPSDRTKDTKGCRECPFYTKCWETDALPEEDPLQARAPLRRGEHRNQRSRIPGVPGVSKEHSEATPKDVRQGSRADQGEQPVRRRRKKPGVPRVREGARQGSEAVKPGDFPQEPPAPTVRDRPVRVRRSPDQARRPVRNLQHED